MVTNERVLWHHENATATMFAPGFVADRGRYCPWTATLRAPLSALGFTSSAYLLSPSIDTKTVVRPPEPKGQGHRSPAALHGQQRPNEPDSSADSTRGENNVRSHPAHFLNPSDLDLSVPYGDHPFVSKYCLAGWLRGHIANV